MIFFDTVLLPDHLYSPATLVVCATVSLSTDQTDSTEAKFTYNGTAMQCDVVVDGDDQLMLELWAQRDYLDGECRGLDMR